MQSQSPRSADHSQLSSTCQQNGAFFSRPSWSPSTSLLSAVSRSHSHAVMVTYSHVDVTSACSHGDMVGHLPVTEVMSTTTCSTVAAAAAVGSTLSFTSFSSLTMSDSLSASQPICQLTAPSAKRLRLPPPSPSLLSMSSGSPPLSPVTHPRCFTHPAAAAPRYPGTTHVTVSYTHLTLPTIYSV